jgi:outer membrane lipoprotein
MNPFKIYLMTIFTAVVAVSCSVISPEVKKQADPPVPFKTLAREADRYAGRTVVVGGYILETQNHADETVIEILQAPLTIRDRPKSMDLSEGRLIVTRKGFLDPAVYRKDRAITVAGTLTRCTLEKVETCRIDSREIYLWPEYEYRYPDYYPIGPVLHPYPHRHRHDPRYRR